MEKPTTHELILPLFAEPAGERKRYPTIVADPPWRYDTPHTVGDGSKGAGAMYPSMTNEELMMLPIGAWAQDDAHLYLWVTNAHMAASYRLVTAWGFEPKTIITWVKGRIEGNRLVQHVGLGTHYRTATEHVLFCVRGRLQPMNHNATTAFIAPRGEHSEKPAAFYDMVEHMSPGPYLDVFSRRQRMGWSTWGNEAYNPDDLLDTLSPEQRAGLVGGGL